MTATGKHCHKCGRNEQQCATTWPCCVECQHWLALNEEGQPRYDIPNHDQRIAMAAEAFQSRVPEVVVVERFIELPPSGAEPAPMSPYLTDPFLRELIPQRLSEKPDNGDGPTACLMRREAAAEAQRVLWEMAADDAKEPLGVSDSQRSVNLSDPTRTVAS